MKTINFSHITKQGFLNLEASFHDFIQTIICCCLPMAMPQEINASYTCCMRMSAAQAGCCC